MILALGSISWIRPICTKLFGILSMKNGAPRLALDARLREILLAESAASCALKAASASG